ncbi:MAG: multifunctional CCA tRNA nucleotidyl transferase/2'3'-cyclic phosphodiesterase/2'nucleotidase/phosphatase [Synergistaceae bacterium]|nr:multifunctional CCA tRNA nucleotidyl transferase/2'3'-cyclic phosphodiesterase/2'nucleotidase/phosphatase [Synergistaceae bacterium]
MRESEFFEITEKAGGAAYLVGGAVRDRLMGRAAHDRDYVVCGLTLERFAELFGDARAVGRSFPVFLLEIDGLLCETAFARRERKADSGYRGFELQYAPDVTIEEDLFRRDITINSMALDKDGRLIDPYRGREDVEARIVRATSKHFSEDPVRALRAARQAAQLGFDIAADTLELMAACARELRDEPEERKFAELEKALSAGSPSLYFRNLLNAGLLEQEYPYIYRLIGKRLPACRPTGDAFDSAMAALDYAAARGAPPEVRFAALMRGTAGRLTHDGTLLSGGGCELPAEILASMRLPKRWRQCAELAVSEGARRQAEKSAAEIRAIIRKLERHPLGCEGFRIVIEAYNGGEAPPFLSDFGRYLSALKSAAALPLPEGLKGKERGELIKSRETAALQKIIEDDERGSRPRKEAEKL